MKGNGGRKGKASAPAPTEAEPGKIPLPKYGEMEKRYDAATRRKLGLG